MNLPNEWLLPIQKQWQPTTILDVSMTTSAINQRSKSINLLRVVFDTRCKRQLNILEYEYMLMSLPLRDVERRVDRYRVDASIEVNFLHVVIITSEHINELCLSTRH